MESYTPLLEKLRVPQPYFQKFAVISIFSKLRSAPPHLNLDSESGRDAISQCLHSSSAAVLDQSVRELCRLVSESKMDLSRGLLELQSALEGCDAKFVPLFVKGLGFLVRFGFRMKEGVWRISATENHPFVKVCWNYDVGGGCLGEFVEAEKKKNSNLWMSFQQHRSRLVTIVKFDVLSNNLASTNILKAKEKLVDFGRLHHSAVIWKILRV